MVRLTAAKHNAKKLFRIENKGRLLVKLEERMARLVLICDGDDLVTHKLGYITRLAVLR